MDLNFEQLLAQHNQEFKEAEVFSDWMPDDGEYIVSVIKLDHNVSKDGMLWWKLTGRIESAENEKLFGKEFQLGFFSSKAFGILKGFVKNLTGEIVNDLGQAHAILQASPGQVLRVKVATSQSKKDGREYTNCYIKEVFQTEAIEENVAGPMLVDETLTQAPPVEIPINTPPIPVPNIPAVEDDIPF